MICLLVLRGALPDILDIFIHLKCLLVDIVGKFFFGSSLRARTNISHSDDNSNNDMDKRIQSG